MKNDINQVAQTIAKEISKFPANQALGNDSVHKFLGYTKRQSEAILMAAWFLKKVEKMNPDNEDEKEEYDSLRSELVDLALEITGK